MNKKEINKESSPKWRSAGLGDLPLIKLLYKKVFSLLKTTKSAEDSPQRHWGMTLCYEQHAFTLIELLVVVLIIGILAAVALPQYQKAVLKSRMVETIALGRAIMLAQEAYKLETGTYTTVKDNLVLSIPENFAGHVQLINDDYPRANISFLDAKIPYAWDFMYEEKKARCYAPAENLAATVCQNITGGNCSDVQNGPFAYCTMSFM